MSLLPLLVPCTPATPIYSWFLSLHLGLHSSVPLLEGPHLALFTYPMTTTKYHILDALPPLPSWLGQAFKLPVLSP